MEYLKLINPIYSTVKIPNLTNTYKLLQITDTHLSSMYEDEILPTISDVEWVRSRNNAPDDIEITKEEMLELLFEFSNKIKPDMVLLTGDIIDTPTQKNFDNLYRCTEKTASPILFSWGNHDWSFVSGYLSNEEGRLHRPSFYSLTKGNDSYCYEIFEDFIIFSIDNTLDESSGVISENAVTAFKEICKKGKPVILIQHIPFHESGDLTQKSTDAWGYDITIGGSKDTGFGTYGYVQRVNDMYQYVAQNNSSPVAAVISGHLHFNHEGRLPNGVPQFVTGAGYSGNCRIITLTGR